ncbi:cytochrome b [Thioclava sp. FR2]|uniref:cytochrome b n=1 Tax=Thioclava sp. FR2 TaxID=3445780 RepID=UPI003EB73F10
MSLPKGYSRAQIALHWVVAVLIVLQFVLHEPIAEAWDVIEDGGVAAFDPVVAMHVFGGLAVLVFAAWRLVLRKTRGAPPPPEAEPAPLKLAAHLGHMALYALMILMPITGAVAWFGGIEASAEVHEAMKPAMLILVAVHLLAALWHQFWLKDGLMLRMKRAEK